jgi:hypothetical protein
VEWRCRLRQIEQRVALYRAWDVLPEALQRSCAEPPRYLDSLTLQSFNEEDGVLVEAWKVLEDYVNRYVITPCCAQLYYPSLRATLLTAHGTN